MVVVEHENVLLLGAHERVDEHGQSGVAGGRSRSGDRRLEGRRHIHVSLAQRRCNIAPEARRIVVVRIQREPGEGQLVLNRDPLGQKGRLPPAGRSGHQVQTAVEPMPKPLDQIPSGHVPGTQPRGVDLGEDQRAVAHPGERTDVHPGDRDGWTKTTHPNCRDAEPNEHSDHRRNRLHRRTHRCAPARAARAGGRIRRPAPSGRPHRRAGRSRHRPRRRGATCRTAARGGPARRVRRPDRRPLLLRRPPRRRAPASGSGLRAPVRARRRHAPRR